LGVPQTLPMVMYEDNQAAIAMVNSSKAMQQSRHIDIQHFAIQEWKQQNLIILEHIPSFISPPDALTKALSWVHAPVMFVA
jgi:hypothetical protein